MNYNDYKNYFINSLDVVIEAEVEQFIQLIFTKYKEKRTFYVIGNGGSAATASLFCSGPGKRNRKGVDSIERIRALSLTDNVPFITALGNDDGYDAHLRTTTQNICCQK